MILLVVLIVLGVVAYWLTPPERRGNPKLLVRAAATGLLATMGVVLAARGRLLIGGLLLGAAVLFGSWRRVRELVAPRPPLAAMGVEEALQVLGLPAGAGADDVRAAHRSLIQKLHPDRGGTTYLAAKLNQARDVLLRQGSAP